jgi:HEAT repeat protein
MKKQATLTVVLVLTALFIWQAASGAALAESPNLNGKTIYLLGESRDPAKADQLLDVLDSSDAHLRRIAVRALGKIGNERAILPLIEILRSKDERSMVRSVAAWALGALNAGQALESLSCCLNDDPQVRREARKAMHKIISHYTMLVSL